MYQNKVILIGFVGSDAEVRTNDNRSFTTHRRMLENTVAQARSIAEEGARKVLRDQSKKESLHATA